MNKEKSPAVPPKNPEKLSGHKLVNYLIAHPQAQGNFKWHSLLSCMWRNLLIAQPVYKEKADFKKINHRDIFKIIDARPELAESFDWQKLLCREQLELLIKYPELAAAEKVSVLPAHLGSELLKKHPHLAPFYPFGKFSAFDWINLISRQMSFAENCPWQNFSCFEWERLLARKKDCLRFLKLEYTRSTDEFRDMLFSCYLGIVESFKGVFAQQSLDAASFLIFKRMDRANGKKFLKRQYWKENWSFADALCNISPEDALDVYGKKYLPFYLTLMAPDHIFEKLFPLFDKSMRDPGGNSLLLPASVYCLWYDSMDRYDFLLAQGFDPDEKNLAGFSCRELMEHLKDKKMREKRRRYGR